MKVKRKYTELSRKLQEAGIELTEEGAGEGEDVKEVVGEARFIKRNYIDFQTKVESGDHVKQLSKRFLDLIDAKFYDGDEEEEVEDD